MNEIVSKFLLAVYKVMSKIHLRQPRLIYNTCTPFTKNKERMQKFKETGDSRYIYQNDLDKAYFQHDMAYKDFKDTSRRKASDKILRDKAFNIAKNRNYDGYQRGLASTVYSFVDKKFYGSGVKSEITSKQQLVISKIITQTNCLKV